MNVSSDYVVAFWALFVILVTWLVQCFIASSSKARQPDAVPGKIDPNLSHDSFVFRAHRTFMNSLENVPMMLGTAFLAILSGANPFWTSLLLWIFAIARIIHMTLYYAIATEKNPSPRTSFFMVGFSANIALLILCAITLI